MSNHIKHGKRNTRGRGKKTVPFGMRLPVELKDALATKAKAEDRDMSYIAERAIRRELEGQG